MGLLDNYLMSGDPSTLANQMTGQGLDAGYANAGVNRNAANAASDAAQGDGFWNQFGRMASGAMDYMDNGGWEAIGSAIDRRNAYAPMHQFQQFDQGPGGTPYAHPGLLTLSNLINQTTRG